MASDNNNNISKLQQFELKSYNFNMLETTIWILGLKYSQGFCAVLKLK